MTDLRKNYYEELIDQMMIDEVSGIDNDIKETLKGLDTYQKRIAILSILDKNRDLFLKIKNLISNTSVGKTEYISQVVKMLREYVKVGETAKKTLGEVMTPISLVEEMVGKLPEEVWSNPNLKWLDPANGCGIFPSVIVQKLMQGLVDFEPNEELRYRHIMENMLYVCELQEKNMFLFLCSFDPKDEYELNIYTGSFLDKGFDEHMVNVWGVEKFDIIVANPPYQTNNIGEKKTHPIWDKFVVKSLNVLVEEGYMCMIHPCSWRNIDGRFKYIQEILKSKKILNLRMFTYKQGQEIFGAAIDVDYYCLHNIKNNDYFTEITCVDNRIEYLNIFNMEYIPNENIGKVYSLVAGVDEDHVDVLYSRTIYGTDKSNMSKENNDTFRYPCIYTVRTTDTPTFWYSKNKMEHFNIPKVIWGNGRSGVLIDSNGDFGLTQFAYAIVDDVEKLPFIKKALQDKFFIEGIMGFRDSLGDRYKRKIIASFRKDFYKQFLNDEDLLELSKIEEMYKLRIKKTDDLAKDLPSLNRHKTETEDEFEFDKNISQFQD